MSTFMNLDMQTLKLLVITAMSAWASLLANRSIAVYHDGIRPIMGEYISGRMKKAELIAISFAMSFGLIIGFGIPFSLSSQVILIHTILLGTDVIGIMSPGAIAALVFGGLYGFGIVAGLETVVKLFEKLPVDIMKGMQMVGDPIVVSFSVLPALTVGYQFGSKKGLFTLVTSLLARVAIGKLNQSHPITIGESILKISPDGMALAIGMIILITFAVLASQKNNTQSAERTSTAALFSENALRIRKNMLPLLVMGGLISLGASLHIIGGSPMDVKFLSENKVQEAIMIAFLKVIGYIPLVVTTGLVSGVWASGGICDWLFGLGYLVSPLFAPFVGAVGMAVEILGLKHLATLLDRYPELRNSGDHIRTAMSQLLEVALLVGGASAANQMAPSFGIFVVAGLYVLNSIAGAPVVKMAVGPLSAILVGILINIFKVAGLV